MRKAVYMFVTFVTDDGEARSPLKGTLVLVTEGQQKRIAESSEFGARMCAYILTRLEERLPELTLSRGAARLAIMKIDDGQGYEDVLRGVGELEEKEGPDLVLDITALEEGISFSPPTVSRAQH